jgi:hypothetical protein
MRWTKLRQEKSQTMLEFKNNLHTLRINMGIKDFERHMVLKNLRALHRYIQTDMDFLNISSLRVTYRYAIKIKHKFRPQNKWEFGFVNPQKTKHGKDNSKQ